MTHVHKCYSYYWESVWKFIFCLVVTLKWLCFDVFIAVLPRLIFSDQSPEDTHMSFIWRLFCKVFIITSLWLSTITMKLHDLWQCTDMWTSHYSPNLMITWESIDDFIVTALRYLTQNNVKVYGDFTVKSPNDDHVVITKWLHFNSHGDPSENNSRDELKMTSPNISHFIIISKQKMVWNFIHLNKYDIYDNLGHHIPDNNTDSYNGCLYYYVTPVV